MVLDFTTIKAVFIDLDGTLLDEKNDHISTANLQAIHKLQKVTNVILSTGRMGQNLNKYLKITKVKYAVAANGSQIIDAHNNEIIWSQVLDSKSVNFALEYAKNHGLAFKFNDEKTAHGVKGLLSKIVCKVLGYKVVKSRHLKTQPIYKLVLWGKSKRKISKLAQQLKKILTNTSIVTSTRGYTMEITHFQATKGHGNQYIWKNLLQIHDIKKTVHIGDSMNDSTVIGFVGNLVVMKNSPSSLIKVADYLGPHYKNGGFAKILRGYDLKPLKNSLNNPKKSIK